MGGVCRKSAGEAAAADSGSGRPSWLTRGPFAGRVDDEQATMEDKSFADHLCQKCVLSYSRVSKESIMGARTIGDLRDYISELRSRENQLNGFDGEDDRVKEGLTGFGRQ